MDCYSDSAGSAPLRDDGVCNDAVFESARDENDDVAFWVIDTVTMMWSTTHCVLSSVW